MAVALTRNVRNGSKGVCALLLIRLAGCGIAPVPVTSGEPNDTFDDATAILLDAAGSAKVRGTVDVYMDLDVYLLGALSAGDRIIVDADTTDSELDVSVAIFDGEQRVVMNSDDRGGSPDRYLDSYIDWIVRHSSDNYYLVVTHSAFAGSGQYTGSYTIDVEASGGSEVPPPTAQLLVLDFDGGTVNSSGLETVTVVPFDAGAIDQVYRGQTEGMKEAIRDTVAQNFERFDVTVQTSDDPAPPSNVLFSTVFFGGFDRNAFGQAESVDNYNEDYCDDAIIYTESFGLSVFTFTPTVSEMGIAIGNVAAHEAGHLLGLNHVDDDRALMDDQSAADVFITDQEFMEAPLSDDIMPIGTHDAVLLLTETVGYIE
ncbi:MAG: matrixin family metalloprotease [Phycisphaerales bacterium]|nr:MAG: matrixin family metalloprotease [Phycisphaerales bacterium]